MIVYGKSVLDEVLRTRYPVRKIYLSEEKAKKFALLEQQLKKLGYPYEYTSKKNLEKLCQEEKNQGIAIDLDFKYSDESALTGNLIVMLDHITDPHNFGAIIRTAVGAGVNAIVIPKDRSVKVTPAVVKVSAGTVLRMPIVIVTNLVQTIEKLKKKGYWIYGADVGGKNLYEEKFTAPICVVFGNEGEGLSRLVKESCDQLIAIPMKSSIDSLNVAVSAGIILFEIARQIG
ncbi:23S rRNA (guanosine(2251)-2'-O)-methyltransferase RlmB [Pseudothermotoga thermarum]|uniref:RNA methyltransferase, TrmH family, group 3 n=1 Tax=Pseudothermotoga thermarum DSM 5069 TaxID=688269 RepID=F7YWR4_9THEM|nr:23S rRNA (guanosine(2251)-2'-O)-methyltransferase RlmB [Pseudothermotoga thermarum]AEH50181.1 RNA methyltransferase, TrmH family, group 3 [Pseudothermotoga thermarum DSM 5069]